MNLHLSEWRIELLIEFKKNEQITNSMDEQYQKILFHYTSIPYYYIYKKCHYQLDYLCL